MDLRPQSIRWLKESFDGQFPRLHYVRFCKKCLFAAGIEMFKNPAENCSISLTKFRKLFNSAGAKDQNAKKIMHALAKGVDTTAIDFYQAIRLHLLAIFELQLLEPIATQDAMDLGRYCLRLAWLYRDINADAALRKRFSARINSLLKALKGPWPAIPASEKLALTLAVNYYQVTLQKSRTVDSDSREITLLYLIARIHLKLGNTREAHTFISLGNEKRRKFESKTKEYLRLQAQRENSTRGNTETASGLPEADKSDEEIAAMAQETRRLKNLADEMQRLFEDCKEERQRRQAAFCRKVIAESDGKSPEELQKFLAGQNIDQEIILKFLPPDGKKKKKGLLGFLFNAP